MYGYFALLLPVSERDDDVVGDAVQVQWIDNKRGRVLTSDDRIEFDDIINEIVDGYEKYGVQRQVVGDLTTYMLIIRRLALTDAGTYTCQINVKASHIHPSKDGMLVVLSAFTLTPHLS